MRAETGWLIEHPIDPRYGRESWYSGKDGFTLDSLLAVRYARKEDACREIDRLPVSLGKSLIATEHAWVSGSLCMVGEEARNDAGRAVRAEESLRRMLKERDDQCNHAIRVNRDEAGQAGYDRALADIGYTVSVGMIAAERRRQVEGESWNNLHDDGHVRGELALAAACYAIQSATLGEDFFVLQERLAVLLWPWASDAWKPGEPIRNLVKAGALIAAEIDRRLRAGEDPK